MKTTPAERDGWTCRVALALVGGAWLLAALAPAAAQIDPSTAPLPDFYRVLDDPRRALVVEVRIGGSGAEYVDAFVGETPPGVNIAEPAMIGIAWYDDQRKKLGSRYAWDPRWEWKKTPDGRETQTVRSEAVGAFDLLFSNEIHRVEIFDGETGDILLDINVRSVVEGFCTADPDDPNCDGFVETDTDGDGGSRIFRDRFEGLAPAMIGSE